MDNRVTVFLIRCGKPHREEAERQTQGQVIVPTVAYVSLANGQVPPTADYGNKVALRMLAHLQCPSPGMRWLCWEQEVRNLTHGENVLCRLQEDCEGIRASLVISWGCC